MPTCRYGHRTQLKLWRIALLRGSHLLQPVLTQLELPELQMCPSCVQVGLQQGQAAGEALHNQFLLQSTGQLSHCFPESDLNLHGSMNRAAAPSLPGFVADLFLFLRSEASQRPMSQPLLQSFTATTVGVGHFHLCGTSQIHVSHGNPFLVRSRPHKNSNSLPFYLLLSIKLWN